MRDETNTIRVSKQDLIKVLTENRAKHIEEYKLAITQFRKDVIEEMTELLANVTNGGRIQVSLRKHMSEPLSFEKEYDKAIRKYSMSVDDVITLDDHQFDQFIMDNFHWKTSVSNSVYSARATSLGR